MLRIDGPGTRLCDGVNRRQLLEVGACSALGLTLPLLLQGTARAKGADLNCIMLWLWGAPSHVDTWDVKPDQPAEIRGLWKPIPTSAPGIQARLPVIPRWSCGGLTVLMSNDELHAAQGSRQT